jgi:hypothetical protein
LPLANHCTGLVLSSITEQFFQRYIYMISILTLSTFQSGAIPIEVLLAKAPPLSISCYTTS